MENNRKNCRLSPKEAKITDDFATKYKFKNTNQLVRKSLVALVSQKRTELTNTNTILAKVLNFFKKELEDTPKNNMVLDNFVTDFIPDLWLQWATKYDPNSKRITKYGPPFHFNTDIGRPKNKEKSSKPGRPKEQGN